MSVFDPEHVKEILARHAASSAPSQFGQGRLPALTGAVEREALRQERLSEKREREERIAHFKRDWDLKRDTLARTWTRATHSDNDKAQLKRIADIHQYVSYIANIILPHGRTIDQGPALLPDEVPLLGPRFISPSPLELKRRGRPVTNDPAAFYYKPVTVLHRVYFPDLLQKCPYCRLLNRPSQVSFEWTSAGPRLDIYGIEQMETSIGQQIRCKTCHQECQGKQKAAQPKEKTPVGLDEQDLMRLDGLQPMADTGITIDEDGYSRPLLNVVSTPSGPDRYCWGTTNVEFWTSFAYYELPPDIPHFFHRSAVTRSLYDLIVEIRPSTTLGGIEENIKQLHRLRYHRDHLSYVKCLREWLGTLDGSSSDREIKPFSTPDSPAGYNDKSISNDAVTEVYLSFGKTRTHESQKYMRQIAGINIGFDQTYKSATKGTVADSLGQRHETQNCDWHLINENSQVLAWRSCKTGSFAELTDILIGYRRRLEILGLPLSVKFTADNCCQVRRFVKVPLAFPDAFVGEDVWHFGSRYTGTISKGPSKNPATSYVSNDITSALLVKPANKQKNQIAIYRDNVTQERLLTDVFEKWDRLGSVWTESSRNTHENQLKHIREGCLAHPNNGLASDGSRIETLHKILNDINRSFALGLVMSLTAKHDVLQRHNIRLTDGAEFASPFDTATYGSHHIGLVNFAATIFNRLGLLLSHAGGVISLPELRNVASGEAFGIVGYQAHDYFGLIGGSTEEVTAAFMDQQYVDRDSFAESIFSATAANGSDSSSSLQLQIATLSATDTTADCGPSVLNSSIKRSAPPSNMTTTSKRRKTMTPNPEPVSQDAGTTTSVPEATSTTAPARLRRIRLTRSEVLFLELSGQNAVSMWIRDGDEYFLFARLRLQHSWVACEMTDSKWMEATIQYNHELDTLLREKSLSSTDPPQFAQKYQPKHARALMRHLAKFEKQILYHILTGDMRSRSGKVQFWTGQCALDPMRSKRKVAKSEDATSSIGKQRKQHVCTRCSQPMHAGKGKSHPRDNCSDGVNSKFEDVLPFPQPSGIYTKGKLLDPESFKNAVHRIIAKWMEGGIDALDLDEHMFVEVYFSRSHMNEDGRVFFKVFEDFSLRRVTKGALVTIAGEQYLDMSVVDDTEA